MKMRWALLLLLAMSLVVLGACGDDEGDGDGGEAAATESSEDCDTAEVTTDEGLVYSDVECGTGDEAKPGDTLSVHYTGKLEDGTEFDSSRQGPPLQFVLGNGDVIKGWDLGFEGMKVGGKRVLTIPPDLGYGATGYPPTIPPDSTLIFDVELVDITSS